PHSRPSVTALDPSNGWRLGTLAGGSRGDVDRPTKRRGYRPVTPLFSGRRLAKLAPSSSATRPSTLGACAVVLRLVAWWWRSSSAGAGRPRSAPPWSPLVVGRHRRLPRRQRLQLNVRSSLVVPRHRRSRP